MGRARYVEGELVPTASLIRKYISHEVLFVIHILNATWNKHRQIIAINTSHVTTMKGRPHITVKWRK